MQGQQELSGGTRHHAVVEGGAHLNWLMSVPSSTDREGLRGDQIPRLGRLLGVADFYNAVTSARAYRPAIPQAEAIRMIVNGAGSHFDPEIVKAVMCLYRRGDLLPSNWKHLLPMRDAGLAAPVPARR